MAVCKKCGPHRIIVIKCCSPSFSLDSLEQGPVPQNSRKLFGSAKQFVELTSSFFKKPDLMYVCNASSTKT